MSQYATATQLKTWMGQQVSATDPGQYDQMTDRVDFTVASDTVAELSLTNASGMIDSYLTQAGISLPLPSTPDVLVMACIHIASFDMAVACSCREEVLMRFNAAKDLAMQWLKDIADGKAALPGIDSGKNQQGSFVSSTTSRLINADNFGNY